MNKLHEESIRVGVIGLGSIANAIHLPILAEMKNVEIVTVMCRTEATMQKVARKFGVKKICPTFKDFLKTKMDCAFILTPKDTHYSYAIPLLESGVDIFCEKPMAMTLEEAHKMVEIANKNKRILSIGFNRRYTPVYRRVKEAFLIQPPDICFLEKNRPNSEYRASFENAIHMIDLMRWFCGECEDLHAYSMFKDPFYETNLTVQFLFPENRSGMLIASRTAGQWMERGELYGGNRTVIVECPEKFKVVDQQKETTVSFTPLAMGWTDVKDNLGFREEIQSFFKSMVTRQPTPTDGSESLKTHILTDKILRQAGLPGL